MIFIALAIAIFGSASAVFSSSNPQASMRLPLPNGQPPWYVYSTSSAHGKVPYATSQDFTNWTPVQGDALPDPGNWVSKSKSAVWAPDVRQITSTSYVMYYTAFSAADGNHCIGAATSSTPVGPFTPQSAPILCDASGGGVIDASGFEAPGGALYLPLGADGYTLQGSATQLITNGPGDGGIVEAPSLVYWDDYYYLYAISLCHSLRCLPASATNGKFFSSNFFKTILYDVSYAIAKNVTGPYTKVQATIARFR
ncbi:glycosyl hydrolase [Mycena capillaripes]|nr:glycosyl hydrolase [Mycena capillaripes]